MVEHPEESNQNNLLRRKKSEELNKKKSIRRVADSNQQDPNLQECVGKVKTIKTDLRF